MRSYKERMNTANKKDARTHQLSASELEKLQNVLLEMFLDIKSVCDRNGLVCMLLGGSALGAVRHQGFIPWDDDLDVGMTREDYDKFRAIFTSELGDNYILNAPNYAIRPITRFPKVLKKDSLFVEVGSIEDERSKVFIDIFIIENVPANAIQRYVLGSVCTLLMFIGSRVLSYETELHNEDRLSLRAVLGKCFSFLPSARWFDYTDNVVGCVKRQTGFLGIPTGRKHYFGEIFRRDTFLPPSNGVFEGHCVYLPGDWDSYLKNLYGDYMTLPPEEKREHHYVSRFSLDAKDMKES